MWAASASKTAPLLMLKQSVVTGLYFYTYNEVAMLALNKVLGLNSSLFGHAFVFTPPVPTQVHPVTHAVANTLKRVVILLACVLFFRTPMTPLCIAGEWMPSCARLLACTSAHSLHIRMSRRLIHRNHWFLLLFCGERHGQGKEGISVSCSFFSSLAGTP